MTQAPGLSTLFSQIAPRYDLLNHVLSLNIDRSWRRKLVSRSDVQPGDRVLDVCTGSGDVAIDFAKHSGGEIIGIDFSYEMLALAQEKARSRGHQQTIQAVMGDASALPFGDGTFDLVSIAFGLRNLSDRRHGILEMTRVLKRGGRLLILELLPPPPGSVGKLYAFYLDRLLPLIGGLVSGSARAYRYLATSVESFLSSEQVLELMADAGLHNLAAERLTCGIAGVHVGEK